MKRINEKMLKNACDLFSTDYLVSKGYYADYQIENGTCYIVLKYLGESSAIRTVITNGTKKECYKFLIDYMRLQEKLR